MTDKYIRPCPFCGNVPIHYNDIDGEYVICQTDDCICWGSGGSLEQWNTRKELLPPSPELKKRSKQLYIAIRAITEARLNLGEPQAGYPAPVAEAHRILCDAEDEIDKLSAGNIKD
jgi:hypothetical protein